jgi:hypothetical protein
MGIPLAFLLILVHYASPCLAQDAAPSPAIIQRWIADLGSPRNQVREQADKHLRNAGPKAELLLLEALQVAKSPEVRQRIEKILLGFGVRYEADFNGWDWVYGGIAHGQTFRALGREITSLHIRVAQLNDNRPKADLEVEIRDPDLKKVYARGFISSKVVDREFTWQKVQLKQLAPLQPQSTYIVFFHSQDTTNQGPWLVNQIYKDLYPDGTHPGDDHDHFFRMLFDDDALLHVGPALNAKAVPINSGNPGGTHYPGPLMLSGIGPVPALP